MIRLVSFALFLATWWIGSLFAGARLLPDPATVFEAILAEARSGALFLHLGATLAGVFLVFPFELALGSALGLLRGRSRRADRFGDPWLLILPTPPALLSQSRSEAAAIAAVAVNKLPNAAV